MASTVDRAGGTTGRAVTTTFAEPDGWVLFAAIMILFAGLWNAIEGFFGFLRSAYYIGHPVFGSLWIWALLWLAFGIVGIAAGGAILSGQGWGRWFGIIVVTLNAFLHMMVIATYPWWAAIMIAVDVLVLYALAVHWKRPAAV